MIRIGAMHDEHDLDHDDGLVGDLPRLLDRRRVLQVFGVAGAAVLVGCGGDDEASSTSTSASSTSSTGDSAMTAATDGTVADSTTATSAVTEAHCTPIPEETAGPFPGDGSNGPNVLAESAVVRRDIRSSVGSSSTMAEGIPLTINLSLLDTTANCTALGGAAVYVWHCDREGRYSLYSEGVEDENYLRGVQEADAKGRVTFDSIFPAAYSGRWPHIHFEVYESLDAATGGGQLLATSQVALPEDACNEVYATAGYEQSVENMTQLSLQTDNVFADDAGSSQLGSVDGDVSSGYSVELTVPVGAG
jgi:protocatechuate 3,4-dioxygenase beta subunit